MSRREMRECRAGDGITAGGPKVDDGLQRCEKVPGEGSEVPTLQVLPVGLPGCREDQQMWIQTPSPPACSIFLILA